MDRPREVTDRPDLSGTAGASDDRLDETMPGSLQGQLTLWAQCPASLRARQRRHQAHKQGLRQTGWALKRAQATAWVEGSACPSQELSASARGTGQASMAPSARPAWQAERNATLPRAQQDDPTPCLLQQVGRAHGSPPDAVGPAAAAGAQAWRAPAAAAAAAGRAPRAVHGQGGRAAASMESGASQIGCMWGLALASIEARPASAWALAARRALVWARSAS